MNQFPGEFAKLRSNPGLIPSMVAEVIRWQTPVAHMCRTAMAHTLPWRVRPELQASRVVRAKTQTRCGETRQTPRSHDLFQAHSQRPHPAPASSHPYRPYSPAHTFRAVILPMPFSACADCSRRREPMGSEWDTASDRSRLLHRHAGAGPMASAAPGIRPGQSGCRWSVPWKGPETA